MEDDNVAIRLKGFIQALGVTNSQFADRCGIPRPSLSQLLGGRNKKISDVIVGQIHQAYPEMNVLWLLFGEGSMMVNNAASSSGAMQNPQGVGPNFREDGLELQSGTISFGSNGFDNADTASSDMQIGQDDSIGVNLFSKPEELSVNRQESRNFGNVRPLNQPKKGYNTTVKQEDDIDARVAGLLKQIDQMKKNPRKVSQITIYYDDSTFETFYPR